MTVKKAKAPAKKPAPRKPAPKKALPAPKKPKASASHSKEAIAARLARFREAVIANGGNGTAAAIEAGFSARTAKQTANKLLTKHPEIRAAIKARQEQLQNKLEITTETVLGELARLSFFDVRRLFNADGSPKPITELDDDTARAIAGLEVIEHYAGKGKDRVFTGYVKKYKLAPKGENLERLARHLGLFEKDNMQKAGMLSGLPREVLKQIAERLKQLNNGGAGRSSVA